ncbi:methyltransferase-like protein 23 isoform X1 [Pseudomyrmex gracilis]|uniref:methyltransferase-like protein 23 isoform X1 n=1 Tax=Pseudomyrmex gracilis TaxID=219809 RepID=UPI000994C12B|nr:methyltransferase-like protein 23 isoform X1 [Pseudomyrmex gracilis]
MPGLEERITHDTSVPSRRALMSDGDRTVNEKVKKFIFTSQRAPDDTKDDNKERLEILIPEVRKEVARKHEDTYSMIEQFLSNASYRCYVLFKLLEANYSFYTWPCAPVLAWYLWEQRENLAGKRILEIGAGTSLPGILASKCGAVVTLSDSASQPKTLQHIKRCCELNGVTDRVRVVGITWGFFLSSLFTLGQLDLIIGSDCFYEPEIFEDIVVIVAFLLERNPRAKFLCTYQERSADWSIEHLLNKWGLSCIHIALNDLDASSNIDVYDLMQDHTIHLLDIQRIE